MSTPQRRYEYAIDARMDKDLAQGFHSYCKVCDANMDNETGDTCKKCREKEIEENRCQIQKV
jgi:hypothetical protein